jgi:hypothetical protein
MSINPGQTHTSLDGVTIDRRASTSTKILVIRIDLRLACRDEITNDRIDELLVHSYYAIDSG